MKVLFNTRRISCIAVSLVALAAVSTATAQYPYQPQPTKASLLVVSSHPDDEGIFFGGALPYYTQVRQLSAVHISMTSGDWNPANLTVREAELRDADWTYGLPSEPLFPRFRDYPTSTLDDTWDVWFDGVIDGDDVAQGRLKAATYVAEQIRRFRPDVIITHDFDGEYGHNNHKATAFATADAWSIAADANVNIDGLPAWQAQKLYVHEYNQNQLFHTDWEDSYSELSGLTPRQVADLGLNEHVSQGRPDVSTFYRTGENFDGHDSERWGLYASTVGLDSTSTGVIGPGVHYGDFFENVVATPEPGALMLLGLGSLTLLRRRRAA